MSLTLYTGNKNYSSWSMRAGVLMRQLGIGFDEVKLRLDFSDGSPFRAALARVTPAGRVPVLVDGDFAVWDTLAIAEYLHEAFPAKGVWPADAKPRARARCLCAEMHAGFAALRQHCPMNLEAGLAEAGRRILAEQPGERSDLERIDRMWCEQLAASGGPMLFGAFCAADAFFAPVAERITTYALPVSAEAAAYVHRLAALDAVRAWRAEALAEHDFIAEDEPYRAPPA